MKLLVLLAAGVVACVSASGESTDGPPTSVTDGPLTGAADGPVTLVADGAVTLVADGPVTLVADSSVTPVADGPVPGVADGPVTSAPDAAVITVADARPTTGADGSLTNVALHGTASASQVWEDDPRFLPDNVIDDSAYDDADARNYWLLPNVTPGWWQVDLGAEFAIRTIKIFNCNNERANDRGTKDFRLEIRDATQDVVRTAAGTLPFTSFSSSTQPTVPRVLDFEAPVRGRYVRIYVDSWYPTRTDPAWPHPTVYSSDPDNQGGGLNEVQVFAVE
jgi:hypothetical protein